MSPALYASVDLGGTNIAAALGRSNGEILAQASTPTLGHEGPGAVLGRIAQLIESLPASGERVASVGLGIPGLADVAAGKTLFLPNLETQWRGVAAAAQLEALLGSPVYLLNDARLAALGELDFGHGREVQDFVFVTLGTGIGGGLVLDGKLRLGPLGAAGEIGHQCLLPGGPLCGCGERGCWEALASASALTAEGVRLVKTGQAPQLSQLCAADLNRINPELMARSTDPAVAEAISQAARYIGIGVANLVTILHPQRVVLGGGLALLGDRLFEPVRREVQRRVRMFPAADVAILPSKTGANAALLGGLALAARYGQI